MAITDFSRQSIKDAYGDAGSFITEAAVGLDSLMAQMRAEAEDVTGSTKRALNAAADQLLRAREQMQNAGRIMNPENVHALFLDAEKK